MIRAWSALVALAPRVLSRYFIFAVYMVAHPSHSTLLAGPAMRWILALALAALGVHQTSAYRPDLHVNITEQGKTKYF